MKNLIAIAAGAMLLAGCATNNPCCDTGCCPTKCNPCAAPCPSCKGMACCKSKCAPCNSNDCKS